MAKKKNTIPSEFDKILDNIYENTSSTEEVTDIDNILFNKDSLEDEEKPNEPPVKTEDGNKTDDTKTTEDDSDNPLDIIDQKDDNTTLDQDSNDDEESIEPSEEDVKEAQQVGLLFDAVGQALGWNMSDINEEDRPLTVDDLANYFAETVRQNSTPEYYDDRVQALDEYVKNGGKFEDFYAKQQEAITLDNIDMEDETNQKAVIKELLKYGNYTDEQINKKIQRYEDNDMLYEESEDALDRLKQIKQSQVEQAAREQEELAKQQELQSKQFFDSVTSEINSLTNIRGISVPKEDRKALFDYIFKVDRDGLTQYQKDFNKNQSKNIIESAYFTMKADALISGAERKGESSAAEKLRKMLRHTSKNHSKYNADEKQKSVTDLLAGAF